MNLEGKVALVSGGNGGIGSALVQALSDNGAVVYSIDIDRIEPTKVAKNINYLPPTDLTNKHELIGALQLIEHDIDLLILSTGLMRRGTIFESSEEDYDLLFNANIKAPWMLLKHLKPKLAENCLVVQVASEHALNPAPDPGLYTLTKKGTVALAEMVKITCPKFDVRIVYPGPVLTKLLLTGRSKVDRDRISKIAFSPAELAKMTIELIKSDKSTLEFDPKNWDYKLK